MPKLLILKLLKSPFGVTELEASVVNKERELTDLNALITSIKSQNDVLVDRVSSFRLQEKATVYENCMGQLEKFQDYRMKVVDDKFDKLYTNFVEMALHLEEKFYPHLLTTVDYTSALQQLRNVNFSLLAELKSNKDASVETVMNILLLTSMEGTSDTALATADTNTALSTTFAYVSSIDHISVDDHEVVGA
nr:hypothetical protein [Tanacetum cinerariifolium]